MWSNETTIIGTTQYDVWIYQGIMEESNLSITVRATGLDTDPRIRYG